MNIASVPSRCGHSCRVLSTRASSRAGQDRLHDLRSSRPARASRSRRRRRRRGGSTSIAASSRLRWSGTSSVEVLGRAPPAGLRPPAQRAQPRAGGVHQHPVEGALAPRRAGAVAGDHAAQAGRGGPGAARDQPWRGGAGARWPARAHPAGRPGPRAARPCRRGPSTRPASARPARRARPRPGPGRPAASPRPARRRDPRPPRGPPTGRRRPARRRTATGCRARRRQPRARRPWRAPGGRRASPSVRRCRPPGGAGSSAAEPSASASASTTQRGWEWAIEA